LRNAANTVSRGAATVMLPETFKRGLPSVLDA